MRISVKWTSCGHRKNMAVLCFYVYADGYRQSVGYYCKDSLDRPHPYGFEGWAEQST
jgi:hypothetical protein